jgi:carbon monoxide dehydrogenase subunit G
MEMDQVWEKIKKGLKDGAALSMEKIEEYTKIGKLKIEEMAAKRKIERNFVDIGERAFELIVDGKGGEIEGDLTVKKAIENIKGLRQELVALDERIKAASEEAKAQRPQEEENDIAGV